MQYFILCVLFEDSNGQLGGAAYGSLYEPVERGSQGGPSNSGPGPRGGGVMRIKVGGILHLDGELNADGLSGSGGASGGSLWVTTGQWN